MCYLNSVVISIASMTQVGATIMLQITCFSMSTQTVTIVLVYNCYYHPLSSMSTDLFIILIVVAIADRC